jgi:hypothetical protein
VLDLVEEHFDQVASPVEIRAEADRLGAIAAGRDVGQRTLPRSKGSDPASVIAASYQEHRPEFRARQQFVRSRLSVPPQPSARAAPASRW